MGGMFQIHETAYAKVLRCEETYNWKPCFLGSVKGSFIIPHSPLE
jgi:hypothetical protein